MNKIKQWVGITILWILFAAFIALAGTGCSNLKISLTDGTVIESTSFLTNKSFGSAAYISEPNSVSFNVDNLKTEAIESLLELLR